jgi:hypothetical protein
LTALSTWHNNTFCRPGKHPSTFSTTFLLYLQLHATIATPSIFIFKVLLKLHYLTRPFFVKCLPNILSSLFVSVEFHGFTALGAVVSSGHAVSSNPLHAKLPRTKILKQLISYYYSESSCSHDLRCILIWITHCGWMLGKATIWAQSHNHLETYRQSRHASRKCARCECMHVVEIASGSFTIAFISAMAQDARWLRIRSAEIGRALSLEARVSTTLRKKASRKQDCILSLSTGLKGASTPTTADSTRRLLVKGREINMPPTCTGGCWRIDKRTWQLATYISDGRISGMTCAAVDATRVIVHDAGVIG